MLRDTGRRRQLGVGRANYFHYGIIHWTNKLKTSQCNQNMNSSPTNEGKSRTVVFWYFRALSHPTATTRLLSSAGTLMHLNFVVCDYLKEMVIHPCASQSRVHEDILIDCEKQASRILSYAKSGSRIHN